MLEPAMILNQIQTFLFEINHYLTSKGCLALAGLLLILLALSKLKTPRVKNTEEMQQTVSAIAGDDVITTQLDLARAYIEMDQKILAKKILMQVIRQGNASQKQEAKLLMETA